MTGVVVWITGVPNSGKTKFSDGLASRIRRKLTTNCIQLDGDLLRQSLSRTLDETSKDRELLGVAYWELAKSLAKQGHIVIVSAVAMYDSVFNNMIKDKQDKVLVHLQCSESELLKRDLNKGTNSSNTQKKAWRDQIIPSEFEKIIHETEEQSEVGIKGIFQIVENLKLAMNEAAQEYRVADEILNQARDKKNSINYWDGFYQLNIVQREPSSFAINMLDQGFLDDCRKILDLGCGNGRDSFYFAQHGKKVLGVDSSNEVISNNLRQLSRDKSLQNLLNFETLTDTYNIRELLLRIRPDCIYARFFFHAIDESSEDEILKTLGEISKSGMTILGEMRTISDPLMRKGLKISSTERIFGHYRRFITPAKFLHKVQNVGFQIIYSRESSGWSVHDSDDPSLLRIVARKR